MTGLLNLIRRNSKVFFKDKGMFFTSLITPVILLVLYVTFLAKVYRDSFTSALPQGAAASESLINATVGGELFSSLLAVACVTVAFCSNMLMVQDKVTGARNDLLVSPVRSWTLALSYYISTFITTLVICLAATGISFIYLANVGWYLSGQDIALIFLDIALLSMFGVALSSVINFFLSSQGQISAVGTIVSAGYGFICGAYMPISQFNQGLQNVLSFLPGTYGTSLIRNHALAGVFTEMEARHYPDQVIEAIKDSVDCNIYFMGDKVDTTTMYIVLTAGILGLIAVYLLLNFIRSKKIS
ncbi:MAG: ABC transporter permease [Bacillota bacterium]|nr:ABC transporter permease [Bacillota bacterium]